MYGHFVTRIEMDVRLRMGGTRYRFGRRSPQHVIKLSGSAKEISLRLLSYQIPATYLLTATPRQPTRP